MAETRLLRFSFPLPGDDKIFFLGIIDPHLAGPDGIDSSVQAQISTAQSGRAGWVLR